MINKKRTGSFYTPKIIADFLVNHISKKLTEGNEISVLEPSVGDGIFIHSILENELLSPKVKRILAIERNKKELNKIASAKPSKKIKYIHSDFLEFQKESRLKFSIVIGNPPYVKKNHLSDRQIALCKEIHSKASLADHEPRNIWSAFLVRCIKFTDDNGILAFVLPAELLQVKFAKELRDLLRREFERIEIFTFNELLFKDCDGQDTLLLVAQRKSNLPGIYYCNVDKAKDLKENKFLLTQNISIKDSKWIHHHMESQEIELLEKIKLNLKTVRDYCDSRAGIVTAANEFFIINESTVKEYSLKRFVKPIVQKGAFVNGSVVLSRREFESLIADSKPAFLLSLNQESKIRDHSKIKKYLRMGVSSEFDKRFKMKERDKWYYVPNVRQPPEAFFFKRCNEYPKLIKNSADVLVTDCAYEVQMKEGLGINDLIHSFYNSLTLCFAELYGRYYGGGVLELTPNEFKSLPMPYLRASVRDFNNFAASFKAKQSISEICAINDRQTLSSPEYAIDDETIQKLAAIRQKLFLRRTKRS